MPNNLPADVALSSPANAARVAIAHSDPTNPVKFEEWREYLHEIQAAIARVQANDLTDIEASLVAQVKILEKQFSHWSEIAARFYTTNPEASERAHRMALKSQKQCTKAIQILIDLKRPRKSATFVKKQQNNLLYQGQPDQIQPDVQQRHADHVRSQDVHVRSQQLPQSQQQEAQFNAQMDSRGQSKASRADTPVEAVAAEHRPAPTV